MMTGLSNVTIVINGLMSSVVISRREDTEIYKNNHFLFGIALYVKLNPTHLHQCRHSRVQCAQQKWIQMIGLWNVTNVRSGLIIKCGDVSEEEYNDFQKYSSFIWYCPACDLMNISISSTGSQLNDKQYVWNIEGV